MERLTKFYRNSDGTGISKKSLVIEEGLKKGMPSGYCGAIVTKLADYEDAEEQGLLLRLPCKVGSHIWVNGVLGCGEAEEYKVIRVDYHSILGTQRNEFYIEALLVRSPEGNSIGFYDKEIGKTVFLTKEEAEQKLAEYKVE